MFNGKWKFFVETCQGDVKSNKSIFKVIGRDSRSFTVQALNESTAQKKTSGRKLFGSNVSSEICKRNGLMKLAGSRAKPLTHRRLLEATLFCLDSASLFCLEATDPAWGVRGGVQMAPPMFCLLIYLEQGQERWLRLWKKRVLGASCRQVEQVPTAAYRCFSGRRMEQFFTVETLLGKTLRQLPY